MVTESLERALVTPQRMTDWCNEDLCSSEWSLYIYSLRGLGWAMTSWFYLTFHTSFPPYLSLSVSLCPPFFCASSDCPPALFSVKKTENGSSYLLRKVEKNRQNLKLPKNSGEKRGKWWLWHEAGDGWGVGMLAGFDKGRLVEENIVSLILIIILW